MLFARFISHLDCHSLLGRAHLRYHYFILFFQTNPRPLAVLIDEDHASILKRYTYCVNRTRLQLASGFKTNNRVVRNPGNLGEASDGEPESCTRHFRLDREHFCILFRF